MRLELYQQLVTLPAFDPALTEQLVPDAVVEFRSLLAASDGIIICTPEYAHGVPGALKNALDWLVDCADLVLKPAAVMSVATSGLGGVRSFCPMVQVLSAMNWQVVIEASLQVPFAKRRFDDELQLRDELTRQRLSIALSALARVVMELR